VVRREREPRHRELDVQVGVLSPSAGRQREAGLTRARWLYLAFFNGLWVAVPVWLLAEAHANIVPAVEERQRMRRARKSA